MIKINFNGEVNTSEINANCFKDQLESLIKQYDGSVNTRITTENDITRLKQSIKEIVENNYFVKDGTIEIYCDYDDELSNDTIKKIMSSDDPRVAFEDELFSWDTGYEEGELIRIVEQSLSSDELELYENNSRDMMDFILETYSFYYPEDHFNKTVKVNIMLDTGNMNYDFTCDNVLNWYGSSSKGDFDDNSSMLWLANQQGKGKLLKRYCRESALKYELGEQKFKDNTVCTDKFVISAIQELANLLSSMGTMTFLVEMELFDLFELKEAIAKEKEFNKSYYLDERKGTGYIVLDKSTVCGLFNTWGGGGSVLDIECEKDIKIPIKCIFDAVVDGTKIYGYDVGEVYGLIGSAWQPTLKEICPMRKEVI